MRQRRKRSAAITLLLAGTMSGCGEPVPQQDVYRSLADCQRDWGDPQQCQPVRDGRYDVVVRQIPEGKVSAGVFLGVVSLAAGILNAACMTY